MLVLPLKAAVRFDIHSALAQWLDSDEEVSFDHKPRNPLEFVVPKPSFRSSDCYTDLQRLQSLRNCLSDALLKSAAHQNALEDNALKDAEEYHAALLEFEKRGFPAAHDEPGSTGLVLTWKGAFSPQQETHATLVWDRANVTFNIAALLSYQASLASPNDREQCKRAVSQCQTAASLLHTLAELVPSQDFSTVDFSESMLLFWERALLAQSQWFVYRMARIPADASTAVNHASLSKLVQSAHLQFNAALQVASQDPRLQSEVPRQAEEWSTYCKAQSMMCAAQAQYHAAVVHRMAGAWGKEIYRMQECLDKLSALKDFLKTVSNPDGVTSWVRKECHAVFPVVKDRFHAADQDNYKIYQDEVPKPGSMGDLEAKQLSRLQTALPQTMLSPQKPLFVNVR